MSEYRVKFEVFEGPMDLLLYLIKKEEVDIYEVNLTRLATQFIEYIDLMRTLDLEIAGEFLVMASTLMYIKSRELLPKDQQVTPEGEDDEDDPRWELIRQLVEYKKFKDAAGRLQELETLQENTYTRIPGRPELEATPDTRRGRLSIFDLLNAVNVILKRFSQREEQRDIFEDKWSVSEKIEHIRHQLTSTEVVKFSTLFAAAESRIEVIVTFLAILELVRLKSVVVQQSEEFGEIDITRAPELPPDIEPEEDEAAESDQPNPEGAETADSAPQQAEPSPAPPTDSQGPRPPLDEPPPQ